MAIRYATVPQFTAVYSMRDISSAQIETFLIRSSLMVNETLACAYTTPFSDNNQTARDLSIDVARLWFMLRTKDPLDSVELKAELDKRFESLCEGKSKMVTDSGDLLESSAFTEGFWSTTQDYKNVFDLRDEDRQHRDPDQLNRFEDQDDAILRPWLWPR